MGTKTAVSSWHVGQLVGAVARQIATPMPAPTRQPMPKGQMPDVGRPTKVDDQLPTVSFDGYFQGTWTFEWDVPEGPLGPSGTITGTTVYKVVEAGKFFSADTDAKGPGGAFK